MFLDTQGITWLALTYDISYIMGTNKHFWIVKKYKKNKIEFNWIKLDNFSFGWLENSTEFVAEEFYLQKAAQFRTVSEYRVVSSSSMPHY